VTDPSVRPGYDPRLEAALEALPAFPVLDDRTVAGWRARSPEPAVFAQALRSAGVAREDRTIKGPGGDLELMILRPARAAGTRNGLLAIHGGGMVLGNRTGNIRELHLLEWIARFGLTIVSPEYRLAPEAPAPAALEDCYACLEWMAANADSIGIDPRRIMLWGISGGGALAAGTALLARDSGGPELLAQLLVYPMLDDRNVTASARQYASTEGPFAGWPTETNAWAWNAVLGEGHSTRADISHYAAPARATDLSRLPPAYLDVGSAEVFRDEVVQYASGLWAAGTQAELHVWAGAYHGFDFLAPQEAVSIAAHAARENWLQRILQQ
jgi:acetyl esterase/lipase